MIPIDQFIKVIDHTYLKTHLEGDSLQKQNEKVRQLVHEAHTKGCFAVCVREHQVSLAKKLLLDLQSSVKIVSVIGFPDGHLFSTDEKIELFEKALSDGADEFDMVFSVNDFLKGNEDIVYDDVYKVSKKIGENYVLKVIFENVLLGDMSSKLRAYNLVRKAFEDSGPSFNASKKIINRFFKTSTGFPKNPPKGLPIGATVEDMALMRKVSLDDIGLKASGGVSSFDQALNIFLACDVPLDPYKFRIGSSTLLHVNVTGA